MCIYGFILCQFTSSFQEQISASVRSLVSYKMISKVEEDDVFNSLGSV